MISSTRNQHVLLCKALHHPRSRREAGAVLIEGVRLTREALRARIEPDLILYDEVALESSEAGRTLLRSIDGLPHSYPAAPAVIEAASDTRAPQGIVMVTKQPPPVPLEELTHQNMVLILDGIGDPGNAGTILRSASGSGVNDVVFVGPSVDPYAPKVVRAAMGTHFHTRIRSASWEDVSPILTGSIEPQGCDTQADAFQIIGADANGEPTIYDIDWRKRTVLVLGSEAHGLSAEASRAMTTRVRVPMTAEVESLNVSAVAAIILFHARHEREARD